MGTAEYRRHPDLPTATAEYRRHPDLPTAVIHRIQSFLSPQQATETTLVSKSWHAAYCSTRPTLDLDESKFPSESSSKLDPLVDFATTTFRRLEQDESKIHTFRLRLKSKWYGLVGLTARWTLKALALGATDLTFRFDSNPKGVYIPIEDIFGSENLVRLSLERSNIDRLKVVKCVGLKSLALSNMEISGHALLEVISCCPLIENLSLREVTNYSYGQKTILALPRLTSLVLREVGFEFQSLFLGDMSSKFPNLKRLTLRLRLKSEYYSLKRKRDKELIIVISSCSLEVLNFMVMLNESDYYDYEGTRRYGMMEADVSAEIDVPSIRKFTFEGNRIPNLSLRSTSGCHEWEESRVSITHRVEFSTTWFCELRKFVASLRPSKIYMYLHVENKKSFEYRKGDFECSNVPEVEDLTMNMYGLPTLSFQALLDALFRACRPKMITQYERNPRDYNDEKKDMFLCRALEHGVRVKNMLIPSQYMYGLRDLEEVNLQKLLDGVWMPQPMDSILDDSTKDRRFRLQLKWKPS